jgi:hypothetical protein
MLRCFPAQIETKRAFQKLPWLLLTCMQTANPIGVMIARGDLAVEIGWERLAEIQEEILWLCEAAHVPVIWATQVSFHPRTGTATLPSRCARHARHCARGGPRSVSLQRRKSREDVKNYAAWPGDLLLRWRKLL